MRYTLIKARESQALSTAEVSKYLNITQRMYCYIEAGTRNGNYEIWDKLEDLFEVPQRQLREISSSKINDVKIVPQNASKDKKKVNETIHSETNKERK